MTMNHRLNLLLAAGLLSLTACAADPGPGDEPEIDEAVGEAEQALCGHDKCDTGAPLVQACGDPCVAQICDIDPYCCTTAWDTTCVSEVTGICGQSCGCSHAKCEVGAALTATCDLCTQAVCAADPYCCSTAWDATCVSEVATYCGVSCNSVGDISYQGCDGLGGSCTSAGSPNPLRDAGSVAISPDDKSVYVIRSGNAAGPVSHFTRAANGSLTYAGCIGQGAAGCTALPAGQTPLYGPASIVAMQSSVYVLSQYGAVAHFQRAANGDLFYVGCNGKPSDGCAPVSGAWFGDTLELAASLDGTSLYVVATTGRGVVHHFRRAANGTLTWSGCIGDGVTGCTAIGATNAMRNPRDIVVSEDGTSVYTLSMDPGAVTHFRRAANGDLTYAGCVGRSSTWQALSGCTVLNAPNPLYEATTIAASPNGASVYVAGGGDLTHFLRNTGNGDIGFAGCLSNTSNPQCAAFAATGSVLLTASGMDVSNDGKSVYVSTRYGALSHFPRAANGDVYFAGCMGQDVAGCSTGAPGNALRSAGDVVVANGNKSVYAPAYDIAVSDSGVVSHFSRVAP